MKKLLALIYFLSFSVGGYSYPTPLKLISLYESGRISEHYFERVFASSVKKHRKPYAENNTAVFSAEQECRVILDFGIQKQLKKAGRVYYCAVTVPDRYSYRYSFSKKWETVGEYPDYAQKYTPLSVFSEEYYQEKPEAVFLMFLPQNYDVQEELFPLTVIVDTHSYLNRCRLKEIFEFFISHKRISPCVVAVIDNYEGLYENIREIEQNYRVKRAGIIAFCDEIKQAECVISCNRPALLCCEFSDSVVHRNILSFMAEGSTSVYFTDKLKNLPVVFAFLHNENTISF